MSSFNIDIARPTGIYFIIERLYARDGLMPSLGEISPSLTQVHRTVIQLRRKQDIYMGGIKITPKDITLWQQIKYMTGTKVIAKDTNNLIYTTEFSGSLIAATPLGNIEHKNIPRFLTTEHVHSLPQIINFGRDPIPQTLLYGRKDIAFLMEQGGKGTPTAIAKYNQNTRDIVIIKDELDASKIMKDLIMHGAKL